jgi:hypothetical protein
MVQLIAARTHKLLKRRGLLHDADARDDTPTDDFAEQAPAMAAVLKSSLFDLPLFSPNAKPERARTSGSSACLPIRASRRATARGWRG